MTPSRFDAQRVLASPLAMEALGHLASAARACDYGNELQPAAAPHDRAACALALGQDIERADVPHELLGDAELDALVAASAFVDSNGTLSPQFALYAAGPTLVLVPRDEAEAPDRVYFARDTLMLSALALEVGPGRGCAADLGTGAGAVALQLTRDYDRVIATDIAPRAAACTAISFRLNAWRDRRASSLVCVADVAVGLRSGQFDLVVANPPWMPANEGRRDLTFANGGATGFELPRRFIMEAARLLAPGGVAVVVTGDLTWTDGRRPLRALEQGIRRLGYDTAIVPTDAASVWPDFESQLLDGIDELAAASHVGLLVHRPASC